MKLTWTPKSDETLRALRQEGRSWDNIGEIFRTTREAVRERGRELGFALPIAAKADSLDDPAREPLPAGHPVSWGAITVGSCLQGAPYHFAETGSDRGDCQEVKETTVFCYI